MLVGYQSLVGGLNCLPQLLKATKKEDTILLSSDLASELFFLFKL
jgi:hypothetical protein